MKRVAVLLLALLVCLTGCGGGEEITIKIEDLADYLLESGAFGETLYQVEADRASLLLGVEVDCPAQIWIGTGATAEELLILDAGDDQEAQTLMEGLEQHVADQTASYASYLPGEVYKLENAILERYGNYVILCVAADAAAAQSVIDGYVK